MVVQTLNKFKATKTTIKSALRPQHLFELLLTHWAEVDLKVRRLDQADAAPSNDEDFPEDKHR
jgi:hypothetical protein